MDQTTKDRPELEKRAAEAHATVMRELWLPRFAEELCAAGVVLDEARLLKAAQIGQRLLDARDQGLIKEPPPASDPLDKMAADLESAFRAGPQTDLAPRLRKHSALVAEVPAIRAAYEALAAVA